MGIKSADPARVANAYRTLAGPLMKRAYRYKPGSNKHSLGDAHCRGNRQAAINIALLRGLKRWFGRGDSA